MKIIEFTDDELKFIYNCMLDQLINSNNNITSNTNSTVIKSIIGKLIEKL